MVFIIVRTTLLLFMFCALREQRWRDTSYHIREERQPELKTLRIMHYQPIFITTTILKKRTHTKLLVLNIGR